MSKEKMNQMPAHPPKRQFDKNIFGRVVKFLFKSYPVLVPITIVCIIFSAIVSAIPSIFTQQIFAVIDKYLLAGNSDWAAARAEIIPKVVVLAVLYILSVIAIIAHTQLMAYITQGFLSKMRREMFEKMQNLPIKYFDTHKHGDIMSHYTNDIDTLRQLVSQSIPSLIQAGIIVTTVLVIMLWFSIPMTLIILLGVVAMIFVSKKIGGGSAKYFIRQQKSIGKTEGFIQEMMNGQKVIKVFCHEEEAKEDFDKINNELFEDGFRAHAYANCLGPIIMNIGNVLYVICATVGGLFIASNFTNLSLRGLLTAGGIAALGFTIDIIVPFLNIKIMS